MSSSKGRISRFLCRFGWHNWAVWIKTDQGPRRRSDGRIVGFYIRQERVCLCCGTHVVKIKDTL